MIGVASVSHYFQPVVEGEDLPSLDGGLKTLCREPFRRIDRFVQLALLGSARCARDHALSADCGIYLGSGLGPLSNNIVVQEQLLRNRELPKPFNFVNTLGSSAGFYVARNLGLAGRNFFISRRGASFQAVLSAALADLALGAVTQALVGVVEEVTLPLADHRRRQQLADAVVPAEGSHWWLLQTSGRAAASLELQHFGEFSGLSDYLQGAGGDEAQLICPRSMPSGFAAGLYTRFPGKASTTGSAFHDSLEAARAAEFCTNESRGDLFLTDGDAERGWTLFHFRP